MGGFDKGNSAGTEVAWPQKPLSQLVDPQRGITYGIVQPGQHDPSGVPILRVNDIRNGQIEVGEVRRVKPMIAEQYRRTALRGGEVLLTVVGTIGETVVVPKKLAGWNVARAISVLPVSGDVSPEWVRLCLQSAEIQGLMRDWCNTTVQPTLNLADVARLPIPVPPSEVRNRIVEILGRLDDKIEVNRRTNRTLEAMAQALYRHWFVDFGPFQDREFVESAVGLAPRGWEVKALDEIATYTNGLALQKYPPKGDAYLPVIKIAEMRRGVTESSDKASPDIDARYIVQDGDVLFSWSGTLLVTLWCGGPGALNQHLFKVTSAQYPKWLYYWATKHHLDEFKQIAANKVTTMGHIQRHHLAEALVAIPPAQDFERIDRTMSLLLSKILECELESRRLSAARDYLLPRLLAGEVEV